MEMNYRKMVDHAKRAGVTNEKTMWESIDSFSELLDELEDSHPVLYWAFMRKQQGIMYGNHYNEEFAQYDVEQIHYTNKAVICNKFLKCCKCRYLKCCNLCILARESCQSSTSAYINRGKVVTTATNGLKCSKLAEINLARETVATAIDLCKCGVIAKL